MSVVSRAPEVAPPRPDAAPFAPGDARREGRHRLATPVRPRPAAGGPARPAGRTRDRTVRAIRRECRAQVDGLNAPYAALGVALAVLWWGSLQVNQSRSPLIVGHGPEEYRRVIVGTFRAFAVLAMFSLAFKIDASRLYLATAFPLGLVGLLVERKLARVGLHRARAQGRAPTKVLVVGGERSAGRLTRWFAKHPNAGYEVSGVWVPDSVTPYRQPGTALPPTFP